MTNIAQQKAISLIKKHTLPFDKLNESDFLIARNSAIHEINLNRVTVGMFDSKYWNDVHEEILKINFEKYRNLEK